MSAGGQQAIDGGGAFCPALGAYLDAAAERLAADYAVVGVIGSQSSGKSTLLNALFDTSFDVMEAGVQRQQTTKGVWLAARPELNLVVLDIEGADSRERWEAKGAVERKTALFGLAVANLLIVNLWLTEVGRFTAANYDILRLIIEMNILHFGREAPKRLLFVVRDFSPDERIEQVEVALRGDVGRLWAEVAKPKGCENRPLEDFIGVEAVGLRHFVYLRAGFDEDVGRLRARFAPGAGDSPLRGCAFRNPPPDALFAFMERVWAAVGANRDVDIAHEKAAVARFRCAEVRDALLAAVDAAIADSEESARAAMFAPSLENALRQFDDRTRYYELAGEERAELRRLIAARFLPFVEAALCRGAEDILAELRQSLGDAPTSVARQRCADGERRFAELAAALGFDAAVAAERLAQFRARLARLVDDFAVAAANRLLADWRRAAAARLDAAAEATLSALSGASWSTLNAALVEAVAELRSRMGDDGRARVGGEERVAVQESELAASLRASLRAKRALVAQSLAERFRALFARDESGAPRAWKSLSDDRVDELFAAARGRLKDSLDFLARGAALAFDGEEVFSREESARLRADFDAAANAMLEAALNEKHSRSALQRVPTWLWLLLAYSMHDNVIGWARNPRFSLIIAFCLLALAALCYSGRHAQILSRADRIAERAHCLLANLADRRFAPRYE